MTAVSVFRDKYSKGWPRHDQGERGYVMQLGRALSLGYKSDAHFVAYKTPNDRRLVREALDQGVAVELSSIVFDCDCAETHGTSEPAPESWRVALREKVRALAAEHPAPFYYETKGGARIVYTQDEPTVLKSQADAQQWSAAYAVAVAYLARRFEITADPSCNDWQRHYRLPHATRAQGGMPENRYKSGDPHAIGALLIEPSEADIAIASRESKAFRPRKIADLGVYHGNGDGLLYHLLDCRREILGSAPRGGWICLCPNRGLHSLNTDGSDSTVVYPPAVGKELGAISCLHAHCSGLRVRDWLRCFSDVELEAAREVAGIKRAS